MVSEHSKDTIPTGLGFLNLKILGQCGLVMHFVQIYLVLPLYYHRGIHTVGAIDYQCECLEERYVVLTHIAGNLTTVMY